MSIFFLHTEEPHTDHRTPGPVSGLVSDKQRRITCLGLLATLKLRHLRVQYVCSTIRAHWLLTFSHWPPAIPCLPRFLQHSSSYVKKLKGVYVQRKCLLMTQAFGGTPHGEQSPPFFEDWDKGNKQPAIFSPDLR